MSLSLMHYGVLYSDCWDADWKTKLIVSRRTKMTYVLYYARRFQEA